MNEGIQQIIEAIKSLAEKLGPSAALLWDQAVRQTVLEGQIYIGLSIAAFVGLIVFGLVWSLSDDDSLPWAVSFIGIVVCFFGSMAGLVFLVHNIGCITNPELFAIQTLKGMLK